MKDLFDTDKIKKKGPLKKRILEAIKTLPYQKRSIVINSFLFQALFPDEIVDTREIYIKHISVMPGEIILEIKQTN
ncbi:MAG: hypothetical protein ACTSWY_00995 [Promethearchaeota archaeon]